MDGSDVRQFRIRKSSSVEPGRFFRLFFLGWIAVLLNSYAANVLYALMILLLAALCLFVFIRRRPGTPRWAEEPRGRYDVDLAVVFILAGSFALAKLLLVVLVTVPVFRYTDAAGVFVPGVAAIGVMMLWDRIQALARMRRAAVVK